MNDKTTTTTDEIMEFLQEQMVTREDAKSFAIKEDLKALETKVTALDTKMGTLPTKSYLDDKIADLKGGVIEKLRKEDAKVEFLIDLMRDRKMISDSDAQTIKREFEVFPQLN